MKNLRYGAIQDVPAYSPPGHTDTKNRRLLGPESGFNKAEIIIGEMGRMGDAKLHVHKQFENIGILLEGQMRNVTPTEDCVSLSNSFTLIPRGLEHMMQSLSDHTKFILVYAPPRQLLEPTEATTELPAFEVPPKLVTAPIEEIEQEVTPGEEFVRVRNLMNPQNGSPDIEIMEVERDVHSISEEKCEPFDTIMVMREGSIRIVTPDEDVTIKSGDYVMIPEGTAHAIECTEANTKYFLFLTPPREHAQ